MLDKKKNILRMKDMFSDHNGVDISKFLIKVHLLRIQLHSQALKFLSYQNVFR